MNRQHIDDNHVVARYLADQLSDEDRAAFEAYYLEHPEMVRELEATARFKAGLSSLQRSGELPSLVAASSWYRQWRYAAAAALVVAVGTALLMSRSERDSNPLLAASLTSLQRDGAPLTLFQSYRIFGARDGRSVDASFPLPAPGQAIELRIDPAQPGRDTATGPYQVSLIKLEAEGKQRLLTTVRGLTPAEDLTLPIYLKGSGVEPGEYQLLVADENQPDAPLTFVVRIDPAR